jgi:hypothetical protein
MGGGAVTRPVTVLMLGLAMACREGAAREAQPPSFDASAAQASVKKAAAIATADCFQQSGPDGPGEVEVRFDPAGIAGGVSVLPEPLSGSARGACIQRVVRFEAAAPAFRGSAPSVRAPIPALTAPGEAAVPARQHRPT